MSEKKFCGLFDKVEQVYCQMAFLDDTVIPRYFTELANDPSSTCYGCTSDFDCVVWNGGNFELTGRDIGLPECLGVLTSYEDKLRIQQQNMIKVLNYLPTGYFKMPKELQDDIRKDIDKAVQDYARFLVDNAKVSTSVEDGTSIDVSSETETVSVETEDEDGAVVTCYQGGNDD